MKLCFSTDSSIQGLVACMYLFPLLHPLQAPIGPPYTNLLVLHRRFTAQLETLLERKSEGCVFVEGGRPHDLAAFDILVIEKENETLRGISKFCGCPPLVKGLSVPFSVIKTITLWRVPAWDF